MSNENLNNIPNWKRKLGDIDSLPGENVPDKNLIWDKLQERLSAKRRRKKSGWFWIAAACIFFALITFTFHESSRKQQDHNSVLKEDPASAATSPNMIDEKDRVPIKNYSHPFSERKSSVTSRKILPKALDVNQTAKLRLTYPVNSTKLFPPPEINEITPIDTITSLATIQPEKKKLKVVHINELDESTPSLPDIVRNADTHFFQFKIANQETYISPTTASNTNGFTIIRIKPAQN